MLHQPFRVAAHVVLLSCLVATGCRSAVRSAARPDPAQAVAAFATAMINADAGELAALFDDDATLFMPFDSVPQRLEGKEQIRSTFARLFEPLRKSKSGPPYMQLVTRDLSTQQLGDTAIVTFHLGSVPDATATAPSMFSRRTVVVQWKGDRWLIQHLHASNMRLEPPAKQE